jgi:hypothetical protein
MRRVVPLLALFVIACGEGTTATDSGVDPLECPTHDGASFELGTGQLEYQPLADGQLLPISPGPQGGCHFFLSVITDGFAERRFKLQYEVFFADSSTTTGSRSSFTVRLRSAEGMPGKCQHLGTTAFLIQPWFLENERLMVEVNVEDDEGRKATRQKTVIAQWPDDLPDDACGQR